MDESELALASGGAEADPTSTLALGAAGELTPLAVWSLVVRRWLESRYESQATRDSYRRQVGRFRDFALSRGVETPAEITAGLLAQYRAEVLASPGAERTRSLRIAAVRSFLRWLSVWVPGLPSTETLSRVFPSLRVRAERRVRVVPAAIEAELLHEAARGSPRDLAIVGLLAVAGLRPSEVVDLRPADLARSTEGWLLSVPGRRSRQVPLLQPLAEALLAYLRESGRRPGVDRGSLFLAEDRAAGAGWRRSGLTRKSIWQIVRRTAERAGLEARGALHPEALRQTFAVAFLRAGGPPQALKRLLGLESVDTARIYVEHADSLEIRAVLERLEVGESLGSAHADAEER